MMSLSDEDLALILEGKAQKLKDGNKSRVEVNRELAQLVAEDVRALYGEDYVNDGRLQSQGRASFGRSNERLKGTAIFVPEGVDDQ
jgi:hypothetical protein